MRVKHQNSGLRKAIKGDATHLHWYNRSISSYLRRGRFFTAFPGRDTKEYVLLLPPGRGVAFALPWGGWSGLGPESVAGCLAGEGCDWAGGEGSPVADTSEPLATLPA